MEIAYVKEINNQRSSLIRLLKKELGEKYSGGLVPDLISKTYYQDCITSLPTDPNSYLDEMKKSAICIYTKGLQDSPARKLAEYLALGKCIVAERYATEFPVPLEDGKNIIFFDTPEECAEICIKLLENPEQVASLSLNARAYFETHVHPVQNVKRILELMLKKPLV
jgi:glycosyltransferase involved in cell wall biosynthesis